MIHKQGDQLIFLPNQPLNTLAELTTHPFSKVIEWVSGARYVAPNIISNSLKQEGQFVEKKLELIRGQFVE
jgi:hypothetical protein